MGNLDGARSFEELQIDLQSLNDAGKSWREISRLPEYEGLAPGTLCSIPKGYEPKNRAVRRQLRLPVLTGSPTEEVCACGNLFVPNVPWRKKCYKCSPVQRKNS